MSGIYTENANGAQIFDLHIITEPYFRDVIIYRSGIRILRYGHPVRATRCSEGWVKGAKTAPRLNLPFVRGLNLKTDVCF